MENWKWIPGYEGYYKVSESGEVLSVGHRKESIRTQSINRLGYKWLVLNIGGTKRSWRTHQLVARTYIPNNVPERKEVNHLDGNKLNNHVSNLEWCTRSENLYHAYRMGLMSNTGVNNPRTSLFEHQIIEIRASTMHINDLAVKYSVSPVTIRHILTGVTWKHIGGAKTTTPIKPRLSKDIRAEIQKLYELGESKSSIARKLDVGRVSVSHFLLGRYFKNEPIT